MRDIQPIHATFVTRRNAPSDGFIFLWGPENVESFDWLSALKRVGLSASATLPIRPTQARLILPAKDGRYRIENVAGCSISAGDAVELLGTASFDFASREGRHRQRRTPCPSVVAWSMASKFALELIARQCFIPSLKTNGHDLYAVWQIAIESSIDIGRMRQLANLMPACAHALYSIPHNRWDKEKSNYRGGPKRRKPTMMWHPEALLRAFLDASVDAFMRKAMARMARAGEIVNTQAMLAALPRPRPSMPLEALLKSAYDVDLGALLARHKVSLQAPAESVSNQEDEEAASELQDDASVHEHDMGDEFPVPPGEIATEDFLRRAMPMKEFVYTTRTELQNLPRWESRWFDGLISPKEQSKIPYHLEDPDLVESLRAWTTPIHEGSMTQDVDARTGFWLEAPASNDEYSAWFLRYVLVAVEDPTLAIPASLVFSIGTERLRIEQHSFENPQEKLLTDLGLAAQFFEPIQRSLDHSKPEGVFLDVKQAWTFISEVSPLLISAGFDVRLPEQLNDQGSRRLRARLRICDLQADDFQDKAHFGLSELAAFRWEAALGEDVVSAEEFKQIVALKQPLVQWRGSWILIDPGQLRDIETLIDRNETCGTLSHFDAMNRALTGVADPNLPNSNIEVVVEGKIADILERLTQEDISDITLKTPDTFVGTLRPYQERGLAWLSYQERLGLGCCLADDMGLGKTIQVIGHFLNHMQRDPNDMRGFLLVCPMSVVGNWRQELKRFAPSLRVIIHHAQSRAQSIEAVRQQLTEPGTVVITTYGLITRDVSFLYAHQWAVVVLDEAQAIKNASSKRSISVRALNASFRIALTGTPIENRLSELWSILDFLNPGLLGTATRFQRLYALPIERYNDETATERLRNLISPFILRRVKSDPSIIQDLPEKMEYKVYCTLTREQATLYQATVDETMRKIEEATGIARHGQVLALLTRLKQIVDHPALFQKDTPITMQRSGKVMRLVEMLEVLIENGEKALIFTQFKEMGDVLVTLLQDAMGIDSVPFLHGSLSAPQRDALVSEFQSEDGPPVFILSLKAGGTGLNLTAATHVFHFDRWWNPAVEEQATDRAYRIGQNKNVQVHKFLSLGSLEEKIDAMLEEKKGLSDAIVDATGTWVTQLDTGALRELFTLSSDAMIDDAE